MTRGLFHSLLLFGFIFSAIACAHPQESKPTKQAADAEIQPAAKPAYVVFKHPEGLFECELPGEWSVKPYPYSDEPTLFFFSEKKYGKAPDKNNASIKIKVYQRSRPNLKEFIRSHDAKPVTALKQWEGEPQLTFVHKSRMFDSPHHRSDAEAKVLTVFLAGDGFYQIALYVPEPDFSRLEPILDHILATFSAGKR